MPTAVGEISMPVPRLARSRLASPVAPPRPGARERNQHARQDAAALTDRDRELILQATGQHIRAGRAGPGWINSLAAAIAADRTAGRLAAGQEITAAYLEDLAHRYDRSPTGRNPISGYLEPALRHLARHEARTGRPEG